MVDFGARARGIQAGSQARTEADRLKEANRIRLEDRAESRRRYEIDSNLRQERFDADQEYRNRDTSGSGGSGGSNPASQEEVERLQRVQNLLRQNMNQKSAMYHLDAIFDAPDIRSRNELRFKVFNDEGLASILKTQTDTKPRPLDLSPDSVDIGLLAKQGITDQDLQNPSVRDALAQHYFSYEKDGETLISSDHQVAKMVKYQAGLTTTKLDAFFEGQDALASALKATYAKQKLDERKQDHVEATAEVDQEIAMITARASFLRASDPNADLTADQKNVKSAGELRKELDTLIPDLGGLNLAQLEKDDPEKYAKVSDTYQDLIQFQKPNMSQADRESLQFIDTALSLADVYVNLDKSQTGLIDNALNKLGFLSDDSSESGNNAYITAAFATARNISFKEDSGGAIPASEMARMEEGFGSLNLQRKPLLGKMLANIERWEGKLDSLSKTADRHTKAFVFAETKRELAELKRGVELILADVPDEPKPVEIDDALFNEMDADAKGGN